MKLTVEQINVIHMKTRGFTNRADVELTFDDREPPVIRLRVFHVVTEIAPDGTWESTAIDTGKPIATSY